MHNLLNFPCWWSPLSFTHLARSSDTQSFKHSMLMICSELHPHGTVEWWGVQTAIHWLAAVPLGMEESHRLALQDKLVDVIMRVLVRHPELHYYQVKGYRVFCLSIWTMCFVGYTVFLLHKVCHAAYFNIWIFVVAFEFDNSLTMNSKNSDASHHRWQTPGLVKMIKCL